MFFTKFTCADVAYVVGKLSRYTHNPSIKH
jgi:hypothetical protein